MIRHQQKVKRIQWIVGIFILLSNFNISVGIAYTLSESPVSQTSAKGDSFPSVFLCSEIHNASLIDKSAISGGQPSQPTTNQDLFISPTELQKAFLDSWISMIQALINQNLNDALEFIASDQREIFRGHWMGLGNHLVDLGHSFRNPVPAVKRKGKE